MSSASITSGRGRTPSSPPPSSGLVAPPPSPSFAPSTSRWPASSSSSSSPSGQHQAQKRSGLLISSSSSSPLLPLCPRCHPLPTLASLPNFNDYVIRRDPLRVLELDRYRRLEASAGGYMKQLQEEEEEEAVRLSARRTRLGLARLTTPLSLLAPDPFYVSSVQLIQHDAVRGTAPRVNKLNASQVTFSLSLSRCHFHLVSRLLFYRIDGATGDLIPPPFRILAFGHVFLLSSLSRCITSVSDARVSQCGRPRIKLRMQLYFSVHNLSVSSSHSAEARDDVECDKIDVVTRGSSDRPPFLCLIECRFLLYLTAVIHTPCTLPTSLPSNTPPRPPPPPI
jgi:hypothetical protein